MSVTTGKRCEKCGYDLTGLDPEGLCPECGTYRDAWSGKGIAGPASDKIRRGDWLVRLFQTLGLLFLATLTLGIGGAYTWKSGNYAPMALTGVIAALFLASAVLTGLSLRKL